MLLQQPISKLLAHYTLGEMFSNKNGVCCYPATDNRTGIRYIVKIQKIPYSPTVTEAFLLSGAFANVEDINAYYKDLAKDLCRQAAILNALSQSEYFSHFTFCESFPCENIGYEVLLIAPFRNTLAALFKKTKLSVKEILELGIALCHGLSLCREAGFLYTGLKPENIYISETGQFTIGDVGFIPLSSLSYAALPSQHHTIYTPVDCHDCFSQISANLDVYSVGIVLYQAFSGGKIPEKIINSPANVPKDIAEIIMTACSPSQNTRWETPEILASALTDCLGRDETH